MKNKELFEFAQENTDTLVYVFNFDELDAEDLAPVAKKFKIQLSICGEMASEKKYIPLLIGLGVKDLSLNPWGVVDAKSWVAGLNYKKCETLADKCLNLDCPEKVDFELNQFLMN